MNDIEMFEMTNEVERIGFESYMDLSMQLAEYPEFLGASAVCATVTSWFKEMCDDEEVKEIFIKKLINDLTQILE